LLFLPAVCSRRSRTTASLQKKDTEICHNSSITSVTGDVPQQYFLFCLQTLSCLPVRSVILAKQSCLVFA